MHFLKWVFENVARYWPGVHNTAFLVIFMDLCEQEYFFADVVVRV